MGSIESALFLTLTDVAWAGAVDALAATTRAVIAMARKAGGR